MELIPTPTTFKQITVNGDGSHVWGITWEDNDIYRNGKDGEWQYATDNSKNWIHVSSAAYTNEIIGIDEAYNVWQRFGFENPWRRRTGSLKQAALTGDGEYGWGVDKDDAVWYRPGRLAQWEKVSGGLSHISVSADGNHVWGNNCNNILFHRKGKQDFWKGMDGGVAKMVAVSADGKNVFKVDRNNKVMWRNGYPGFFMMDKTAGRDIVYEDGGRRRLAMSGNSARQLGSMGAAPSNSDSPPPASSEPQEEPAEKIPLREVSVSESGDQIYAVDVENTLWHTTGINRPWVKVTVPGGMTSVSVTKEDTLWTINMNGKPAWRDGADADFMELSGDLMYVESSADETAVWGANSLHIMFWRRGREPGSFWNPLPPTESRAKQISVSGDGSHVWYVNRNNDVFYRTGFETPQQEFPGVKLKQVAVSADGNHVWGVTDERDVWYRPGTSGDWTPVEAPALDYISLNGDGGMLYGVNMETGSTWYRFC